MGRSLRGQKKGKGKEERGTLRGRGKGKKKGMKSTNVWIGKTTFRDREL